MVEKLTDDIRKKLAPGLAKLELKTPAEMLAENTKLRKHLDVLSKALWEIALDKNGDSEQHANRAMAALAELTQ